MLPDGLHILLLSQCLAANLLAAVGNRHHAAQDLVQHIRLALPRQRHGIAHAAPVHQVAPANHVQQLEDDGLRQRGILLVALHNQLVSAQRDAHAALLLQQCHILVIETEQGHVGIHGR